MLSARGRPATGQTVIPPGLDHALTVAEGRPHNHPWASTRGGQGEYMQHSPDHGVAGFRPLSVIAIDHDSVDVFSLTMRSADGQPLALPLPGQHVVMRLRRTAGGSELLRSYSLSGPPSTERYRISVKLEPNGAAGTYLREYVRVGHALDVSAPRGGFVLRPGDRPIVLLSAGIGATPVLAMLQALVAARATRRVLWLHGARDRRHHPFAAEARGLISALAHGRSHVCFSAPGSCDKMGEDFDASGHLSRSVFEELVLPRDSDVYLCGPARFRAEMKEALVAFGVAAERIHIEVFDATLP